MFNRNLHLTTLILTIIVTRLMLAIVWEQSWMTGIKDDSWHHAYTGIIIFLFAINFLRKHRIIFPVLSGIGLGLLFDEVSLIVHWIFKSYNYSPGYWDELSYIPAVVVTLLYVLVIKFCRRFSC